MSGESDAMNASQPDPQDVVSFLSAPGSYRDSPAEIGVIETHASRVFLAGAYAYKIKKPVKLPFLDFSTLALRKKALERELELNRPHAPEIYLELVPLARHSDGSLAFGSGGDIVEYALKMRRFEQACLLSRIADKAPLSTDLSRKLAKMVAGYHRAAPITYDTSATLSMQQTISNLVREMRDLKDLLGTTDIETISTAIERAATRAMPLMQERQKHGTVRRCHGDLHLNNIVLLEGDPVPFDALEFDERLGVIDVLYDLAFLLMDLDDRNNRSAANIVLNSYVSERPIGHEIEGLALLPLLLATRAIVRAVVSGERVRQLGTNERDATRATAQRYLNLAAAYLKPAQPCLIAVGGLSGTGKSTLAASLAPLVGAAPGALHLRSDVERKHLFGVGETVRLGPDAYTSDVTEQVYDRVLDKAERSLRAGHAAIVDVVASSPDERRAIAAIAQRTGCPFVGIWLEAPIATLIERVKARRGDASDADAAVVRRQADYELGENTWTRIDASGTARQTLNSAIAATAKAGIEIHPDPTDA